MNPCGYRTRVLTHSGNLLRLVAHESFHLAARFSIKASSNSFFPWMQWVVKCGICSHLAQQSEDFTTSGAGSLTGSLNPIRLSNDCICSQFNRENGENGERTANVQHPGNGRLPGSLHVDLQGPRWHGTNVVQTCVMGRDGQWLSFKYLPSRLREERCMDL